MKGLHPSLIALCLAAGALLPLTNGAVVVNEVASTGSTAVCVASADHVELHNTDPSNSVDITGYLLGDPSGNFTLPAGTIITGGGYLVFCEDAPGSFTFGISPTDTVTLRFPNGTLTSTSGALTGLGTATSTYQRKPDGTYAYSTPSPGAANVFVTAVPLDVVVINEVADKAVNSTCAVADDFIELHNRSPTTSVNISGYSIRDNNPNNPSLIIVNTTLAPLAFKVYCSVDLPFGIGGDDTITLFNAANVSVSTTGPMPNGGTTILTYQRKGDGNYTYAKATPNAPNAFSSPLTNVIVINEVANTGVGPTVCNNDDYVELLNTGATTVNLSGFILHDDKGPLASDRYTFPGSSSIAAGQFLLLCTTSQFPFGLSGTDSVSLLDATGGIVAETGRLLGFGTSTLTYQRTASGTYGYNTPTPGAANAVPSGFQAVINEVAPTGVSNTTFCNGGPFIELLNTGDGTLNLAGFTLIIPPPSLIPGYVFPNTTATISFGGFGVFCRNTTYLFDIGERDAVSLLNPAGQAISTTGAIGGASPRPKAVDLAWVRVVDLVNVTNPAPPSYQYSTTPTPGRANVFSFVAINTTLKTCGVQGAALPCLADYEFKDKILFNRTDGANPELSGGAYDGSACTNLLIGDEGTINEVVFDGAIPRIIRTLPVFGGSRDTEGICYYSPGKVAIIDERERSVALCDYPAPTQFAPIFRDSSNCRVMALTDSQKTQTSADANEGFEDVACDPANGKLYVIQEKNPMKVWSLDVATGLYSVLIDVQTLPSWTSQVTDLAGLTYDPIGKTLYVLSQESKRIVQSAMNGTIIGPGLNVSMGNQPEGLYFVPSTGELIAQAEPNEVIRFVKKTSGLVCTPAPAAPPVAPPVAAPVTAPVPVAIPTAPVGVPVKAPASPPVASPITPSGECPPSDDCRRQGSTISRKIFGICFSRCVRSPRRFLKRGWKCGNGC